MPFQTRKIRLHNDSSREGKFLKTFEKKTKKRFEHISEKFAQKKFPFTHSKLEKELGKNNPKNNTAKNNKNTNKNTNEESLHATTLRSEKRSDENFFYYSNTKKKHSYRGFFLVLFFLGLLIFGGVFAYKSLGGKKIFEGTLQIATKTLGAELTKDEKGRTNILLLGAGGATHDGGYLTDSIIVASLDIEKKNVSLLSIPRDLYVDYRIANKKKEGKINKIFPDSFRYWGYREKDISTIFSNASNDTITKIEEIVGTEIHYTLYIDFSGFEKIIDEMGGISVNVEKRIYDPSYPGPNYSYQTFRLEEGLQLLDGETALKYVRSRHGTSGGDFGRSYRQKKAIIAIKNKAIESGLLSSPEKIKAMFGIIQENFWTDLDFQEMLTLITFAKEISKDKIVSVGITNEAYEGVGGFLYDGVREDFNGMSVFLPYLRGEKNEFAQIEYFFDVISLFPELTQGDGRIKIYNTTTRPGLAKKLEAHLLRYFIKTVEIGSTDETYSKTSVEYVSTPENEEIVEFLKRKIDAEYISVLETPDMDTNIFKIFIGKDFSSNPYTGTMIRTPKAEENFAFLQKSQ